jgi:hypothetical protein
LRAVLADSLRFGFARVWLPRIYLFVVFAVICSPSHSDASPALVRVALSCRPEYLRYCWLACLSVAPLVVVLACGLLLAALWGSWCVLLYSFTGTLLGWAFSLRSCVLRSLLLFSIG